MIDKLEIRVPPLTLFGPALGPIARDLQRGLPVPGFRSSSFYRQVGDLRPFGINAIAHLSCKRGKQPSSKLELLETGQVGLENILSTVEQAFRFDPLSAEVMRVDLAADVPDVPVSYFEDAAYAEYKRWVCDIGKLERSRMGTAEVETIYLGKRPNCIRIYNKIAEWQRQYRELERELKPRARPLPFEKVFQVPESAVLTRVERQIGAGRVPPQLLTIRRLQENATVFNPFERLRLQAGASTLPRPDQIGLSAWLQGMQLRAMVLHRGIHRVRRFLSRHSKGNAARMLSQYAAFLPNGNGQGLTSERLYEIYQESVTQQLAG